MDYKVIQNNPGYEEIIKTHLRYLFPLEVGRINGVETLTKYWFGSDTIYKRKV